MKEPNEKIPESGSRQPHRSFWQHARFPAHTATLDQIDGSAMGVGSCGDKVTISIAVAADCIQAIYQFADGCVYTTACASAVGVLAHRQTLEKALDLQPEDVEKELGGLPEDHRHCARLAVNTLGEAIAEYYRRAQIKAPKPVQSEQS